VKSALYDLRADLRIVGFIGAIGGRDLSINEFKYMVTRAMERAKTVEPGGAIAAEMIGVRD
jgi:hypothetical protein